MEGEAPAGASPLGLVERRILGVLVEKARTVPDTYPLSLNALVVGCNQKSNRDPLMDLQEIEIQDCLETLIKKKLVARVVGGRVERWRHQLYEVYALDKKEIAVIAELLLRGPQTEGELRQRASRMEPIDDLEILRGVLRGLMERNLVVALVPLERRGAQVTHGFPRPRRIGGLAAAGRGSRVGTGCPARRGPFHGWDGRPASAGGQPGTAGGGIDQPAGCHDPPRGLTARQRAGPVPAWSISR